VPGRKRGALVDRFCNDPACRVFLSTDAGGVGLNLQHAASTVINMDMPWNPAVLEQRIGCVHRLGQTRCVQVVNFVAQGTIEEGMLSTLAFKKSLFAGVLDGGDAEIFMEGTRLTKFMESVNAVTTRSHGTPAASETPVVAAALPQPAVSRMADAKPQSPADSTVVADPLAGLLEAGLQLMQTLVAARNANGGVQAGGTAPWIETDPQTGQSYVKLPLPPADTMQRAAAALAELVAALKQ
jgi:hypothetical protein